MTNLISADTDKFSMLMPYINLVWSAPLQLVICFFMLAQYVSYALFAGIVVMFSFMALSAWVAQKARKVQAEAMKAKDERLKTQTELLKIVKIIKLYAWETTIEDRVRQLREKEMKFQLHYKLWNMGVFLCFSLSPTLVALATFTFYTGVLGKELDAATAFTSLSLFNILSFPLGAVPMMARFLMEAKVSKDRLEAHFLAPEVAPRPGPPPEPQVAIDIQADRLAWPDGTELLRNVSLKVNKGSFLAIVGRTGTGKSGLLYAMLGELPMTRGPKGELGRTYLRGTVGYCAQSAWVRNASVRVNITDSTDLAEDRRYDDVIDACALRQDLEALPERDMTMIGDRGINLSGGQKQRIAIARAVYANPDILILDDVLSALDSHVTSHICNNLLRGPLVEGKTVVLVTHSKRALPLADRIVDLSNGEITFSGTYAEFAESGLQSELESDALSKSNADLVGLDDKESNGKKIRSWRSQEGRAEEGSGRRAGGAVSRCGGVENLPRVCRCVWRNYPCWRFRPDRCPVRGQQEHVGRVSDTLERHGRGCQRSRGVCLHIAPWLHHRHDVHGFSDLRRPEWVPATA